MDGESEAHGVEVGIRADLVARNVLVEGILRVERLEGEITDVTRPFQEVPARGQCLVSILIHKLCRVDVKPVAELLREGVNLALTDEGCRSCSEVERASGNAKNICSCQTGKSGLLEVEEGAELADNIFLNRGTCLDVADHGRVIFCGILQFLTTHTVRIAMTWEERVWASNVYQR